MGSQLVTTEAAAEKLGISPSQFSRIYRARGYAPDHVESWHYGRRSGDRHLWAARTLAALARTREVREARERRIRRDGAAAERRVAAEAHARREERSRARLPGKIAALFASPRAALASACDAMWALNRSTDAKSSYGLKTRLIRHLYDAEVFTDRVEKLSRTLPPRECWECDGDGCDRCYDTGVYLPGREVCSYLFTFTVDGRKFVWRQPDFALTFEPEVEAERPDDGRGPSGETLALPSRRVWSLRALVEYAISEPIAPPEPVDACDEEDDDHGASTDVGPSGDGRTLAGPNEIVAFPV